MPNSAASLSAGSVGKQAKLQGISFRVPGTDFGNCFVWAWQRQRLENVSAKKKQERTFQLKVSQLWKIKLWGRINRERNTHTSR